MAEEEESVRSPDIKGRQGGSWSFIVSVSIEVDVMRSGKATSLMETKSRREGQTLRINSRNIEKVDPRPIVGRENTPVANKTWTKLDP